MKFYVLRLVDWLPNAVTFEGDSHKMLLHSLGLVYKSMRGMMTNSIDRDQWLNVTSESRDRI
jgi:hypothetical protein